MNGMPPMPKQEKKIGPIVGALIIVLILIIAALYFFGQKLNTPTAPAQETVPTVQTNENMPAAAAKSDDTDTLQAELNAELKDVDYSF